MESTDSVVCLSTTNEGATTYNIIRINPSKGVPILCQTCKSGKCLHIKTLLQQTDNDIVNRIQQFLSEKIIETPRYIPACLSKNKIPFSKSMGEASNQMYYNSSCSCHAEKEEVISYLPLFELTTVTDQEVKTTWCPTCKTYSDYDGCNEEILNMGTYLMSHAVLRQYMKQFLTEGTSMASFYKEWVWTLVENGKKDIKEKIPYYRFKYAWYAWIDLLDINYAEGFACPDCGDQPDLVIMDGVTLGIRRSFLPWDKVENKNVEKTFDGSYHPSRVFINNEKTRSLLLKYVGKGLSPSEFLSLRQNISMYQPAMNKLMEELEETGFVAKAPDYISPFLKYLGCNYPVCGWLHYDEHLYEILTSFCEGKLLEEAEFLKISELAPILADMLKKVEIQILGPIIEEVIIKSKVPFKRGVPHDLPPVEHEDLCGFFPTLPKWCERGTYILDNKNSNVKVQEGKCEKRSGRHPTLTPGLFTLSCQHGVCYGFHLMDDVESPNVPYTILRTRFRDAPKVVIYDNACNLGNYALNRDPVFFKNTWFLVDRFHWCNHTGCPEGYSLGIYPQFNNVNTQVAEQRNATLKKIKPMLSYMNFDNFMQNCKLFIWFRSMIATASRFESLPIKDFEFFSQLKKVYSTLNC